jgi:hypothetical protein
MKEKKHLVTWKGEVVGEISNLKSDNFDVYGNWNPVDTEILVLFLEAIESDSVVVRIGTNEPALLGTVEFIPDHEIEIKIRPNLVEI